MRRWAAVEVLAPTGDGAFRRMVVQESRLRAGLLGFAAGAVVGEHAHLESDEIFHVVEGRATFVVDDVPHETGPGDLLHVAAGERHEIRVHDAPLVLLAVVAPNLDDAWVAQPARGAP